MVVNATQPVIAPGARWDSSPEGLLSKGMKVEAARPESTPLLNQVQYDARTSGGLTKFVTLNLFQGPPSGTCSAGGRVDAETRSA